MVTKKLALKKKSYEAAKIVSLLKKNGATVAVAESITAGGLAECITEVPGASDVFVGGVVAYSDAMKTALLSVPKRLITKHTAVSEEVAIAMAQGAREITKATYAIATTGVAGPGAAYGQKPGTVWIAIASKKQTQTIALALAGDRQTVRNATITSAIAAFERILLS